MKTLALVTLLALAGCAATPEQITAFATRECAPLKAHSTTEFETCVVQTTIKCKQDQSRAGGRLECRP